MPLLVFGMCGRYNIIFVFACAFRYNIMSYFSNRAAAKRPTLAVSLNINFFYFVYYYFFLVFVVVTGVVFYFSFTLFVGREQPPALKSPVVSPSKPLRSRFVFFLSCITAFVVSCIINYGVVLIYPVCLV